MNEISNKMIILLTYAAVYDMPAEPGRDAMKGCTVNYFFLGETGRAFAPVHERSVDKPVGFQRNKVSMDYSIKAKIPCAPGIYEGTFGMTTGGDGKPILKLMDVDFIAEFNVMDYLSDRFEVVEDAGASGKAAKDPADDAAKKPAGNK